MRYYKQIILSLIVLSCAFITGNAQEELLFRHLTRNEGLLHDNVTCIVQDSLGYMWFGSHRGLNRYDGYSIDSYKYENGIINSVYYNRVYSIQIVGRYIWLATEAGLACFDIRTKQFVSYRTEAQPDPAFYSKVRMLKQGIGNQLWLISDNQIRLVKVESSEKDNAPGYKFPPLSLLNTPTVTKDHNLEEGIRHQCGILEQTLSDFKVRASVVAVTRGPSVTRFELEPAPGGKATTKSKRGS